MTVRGRNSSDSMISHTNSIKSEAPICARTSQPCCFVLLSLVLRILGNLVLPSFFPIACIMVASAAICTPYNDLQIPVSEQGFAVHPKGTQRDVIKRGFTMEYPFYWRNRRACRSCVVRQSTSGISLRSRRRRKQATVMSATLLHSHAV